MRNRRENPRAYRFLTTMLMVTLTSGAGACAAACCELPDAGDLSQRDTGQATVQEAWVDLRVDSARTVDDPYGGRRIHTTLRVLRKRPADTSVFFERIPPPATPDRWITTLTHTAETFPDILVDSASNKSFTVGDTLNGVFAARIVSTSGRTYLALGGLQCKPLAPVPGPFPIGDALKALDRFRDSLAAAQGQVPPPRVRIGPIFIGVGGDSRLLVRAEASGDAWLIRYQTGSGDCPVGCTEHEETVYRVGATGKAEVASSRRFFAVCWSPDPLRPIAPRNRPAPGASGCYTPDGRMFPGNRPPEAALPWLGRP